MNTLIPIIKIVGNSCNLRCDYCFYHCKNQSAHYLISDELIEKFISQYLDLFSGRLFFIWHGGEPMLAGIPFFQRILNLQRKYLQDGQTIKNAIQTNATLITNKWAEFFKFNDFKVGISLDGGKESHNRFRKDKNGNGSFDRAIKGMAILRRYGIQPGIIQTLGKDNIANAEKDFNFFAGILLAKRWGINEFLDAENDNKTMANQSLTNQQLTDFLKTCIDLWLAADNSRLQIREIDNFIAGILGKRASSCKFNGYCARYFCLDYDGKIYPCDRLSNDDKFILGDLTKQSLPEVLFGAVKKNYDEEVNTLPDDCASCKWRNACNNGCAAHRIGSIRGKYYYCETRKTIFDYLEGKITNHRAKR